jgi:L-alanine-DL-glutamate epimerase-like enolase superfamily enzyme
MRSLSVVARAFPLTRPFRIARGTKTAADVVHVVIGEGGATGRGEGVPYPRYGESVTGAIAAIEGVRDAIAAGAGRDAIAALLPAGAARNAVDCALWDLEARLTGRGVAALAGVAPARRQATAMTVGWTPRPRWHRPPPRWRMFRC